MKWFEELNNKYSSGVSVGFILHLNTADYVKPGVSLRSYLGQVMADKEVVAFYNRAEGITFPVETMEEKFKSLIDFQPDPLAGDELPKSPAQALPLLEKLLKVGIKKVGDQGDTEKVTTAVIIDHADTLVPDADIAMMIPEDRTNLVTIRRWATDPGIIQKGNMIILVSTNLSDINRSVKAASSRYESIRLPYPDEESRFEFISYLSGREWTFESTSTAKDLARATAGLSLIHIEDIYLRAEQAGKLDWELVTDRKRDVMRSEFADVLEMMEPRYGFEAIGGLELVKDFFRRNVIEPMKDGRFGRVPMGVLMTGPAGTGKTIMAEAVAKESGINMAVLNPAKIFSKWVGESERNLEKALEAVKSLAPTLVFIDEIDQQLRRGESGDSGVSNRVFKRLMEFMSDTGNRGRVVFVAATNRPDLLDAAIKRPGRFDAKIPFLAPDPSSRAQIFMVMSKKYGFSLKGVGATILNQWAEDTDGWTGAEIERVVIKAGALREDRGISTNDAMKIALGLILAKTQDIEYMTEIAIAECDDLEFIPEEYRKGVQAK